MLLTRLPVLPHCSLAIVFAICTSLAGNSPRGWAQQAQATVAMHTDDVHLAIQRGLAFLATHQKESGAIAQWQHETAMSALSIMAYASVGVTPQVDSEDGAIVRRALDFVLQDDRWEPSGYCGNRDGSRMYGHGIVTLMLTELQGMGASEKQNQRIRERCELAILLILNAQRHRKPPQYRGGWRYSPDAGDADLSVSVWQLMALRSAKANGMDIPDEAIGAALAYLRRSCTSPLDRDGQPLKSESGFAYTPGSQDIQFTMTAAGLLAMQVCGQFDSPLVQQAEKWLVDHPPRWGERYFFYGTYYYAQGMHQRLGDSARTAENQVREVLLAHQQQDGGWNPEGEEAGAGRIYATAMAILSLSVKYHYLPIYQR